MQTQEADDLRFGPFRLSRRRREICTDAGPVAIGGRAFDLLLLLLDRQGALVSRHELLDLIWHGLAVEDNNVQVQVATLRRALGAHHALVQTVPGRGYRFAGEIERSVARGVQPGFGEPDQAVFARPPSNLPALTARLVGRGTELDELCGLLGDQRLITITGPSGIGKTRLAVALGQAVLETWPGGVTLVDLAPIGDAALIPGAVLAALGLRPEEGIAPEEAIAAALRDRRCLVLLDNCEHLAAGAAGMIDRLIRRCASLSVVATSQEPLRIDTEMVYRLDPLTLPPRGVADIGQYGAVELFVQRIIAADRRFRLEPANAATVADICHQLDGIPLALEMAAARVPMLGLEGLRARLHERLRVLTSSARTVEPRHRTLRATVAWSFELLEEADRMVFRRLGAFAGGFSADAATAIAAEPDSDGWQVVDALGRLIDKSLVVAESGDRPRYRLLETLRLFALEQLAAGGERDQLAARHAAYFDRLLQDAYEAWETTDDTAWLQRHAPELDNVRAAVDWALEAAGRPGAGSGAARLCAVSLAGSAALLWDKMSLHQEGARYLEQAEALIDAATQEACAARLLRQLGNLLHVTDRPQALTPLSRAAGLYERIGDHAGLGAVLALIGSIHVVSGAHELATDALRRAQALLPAGRPKSEINVLNNLGVLAALTGEFPAARDLFGQVLRVARRSGMRDREAMAQINLAEVDFHLGDYAQAAERTASAVEHLRLARQHADLGWALVNLTSYRLFCAQLADAGAAATEALALVRSSGGLILRACIQNWALIGAMTGQHGAAARLAGWLDASYAAAEEARQPTEQLVDNELRERLQASLTPARLATLAEEGAAWSDADAADAAAALGQGAPPPGPPLG